ncbi:MULTISPECIES: type III glutamate--ammonia ligase [unclassified Pseudomonas]|uniref:type III glutamate--ammonia ligase n=1 Tax=unclassified Pseudomonas TaxID=196821 RepID=UPI000BDB3535|nr:MULTISPECIES: type III glutamate--ammonia ligase [unclassified Pseudomonas]PVZ20081.1 gamma-glutamylmethylamide synthetase [Pseudomonas sp. URIL14HWK12:I12]PVZ27147.1 gamma-glutamylmethylamide synthetase [Pseudomonas sp. URIL14HWK12:I10]PVZ38036.1 gamma-glutamylmethylamide synthetase [Pseudomonas sp. URIL14HWK12:I11]SNZ04751.1 gamma-glutamylmethylamide synthetase [Pseudomonas sp. URIL14HWK12:I9]
MLPAETQRLIEQHGIKYVLAQFVDIHGSAKTKSVPVSGLEAVSEAGAGFAGFAISGMGMQPNGPDFMAKGDLCSLIPVPWQPGYGRVVCIGHVDGEPWPYDSRYVLQQQTARLSERGWYLNTGLEPEFNLFQRGEGGKLQLVDASDNLDKPCYDYKGLSRSRQFLERLTEALQPVGFDIYQIDHEDANGQFEINYTFSEAMESADRFTFFRMAAGEIANEMGMICSFMPKPDPKRAGNGMHFHLSIGSASSKNLFHDASDPSGMGLSKLAYHFAAGLLAHGPALCAFAAPTVNSYKRLVVGNSLSGATWAPAFIAFGANNRSAMVRVPYGRLEFRLPDAGCNPYLVSAAIIAAGLDGIDRQLDVPEVCNDNLYSLSLEAIAARGIKTLPQSLKEACDALEADPLFAEVMGPQIVGEFIRLKRMEWVEYSRHVSDWEVQRYTEFF